MKTKQELIIEFGQDFRKEQKHGVRMLPLYILLVIILIIIECSLEWFIVYSGLPNLRKTSDDPLSLLAFLIFVFAPLFMFYLTVIFLPSEFFKGYNITKKEKENRTDLEQLIKRKLASERRCRMLKDKLDSLKRETSMSNYILHIIECTEKLLRENEEYKERIVGGILRLEAELEVWANISEKTFWQYLWSLKWIKKEPLGDPFVIFNT